MAKKTNYTRTGVSLPKELKGKMQRHPNESWSRIAARSFAARIEQLERDEQVEKAAVNIRALRASAQPEGYRDGRERATRWAAGVDDYQPVRRLADLATELIQHWGVVNLRERVDDTNFAEFVFEVARPEPANTLSPPRNPAAVFAVQAFGADCEDVGDDLAGGFVHGALDVWQAAIGSTG